MNALTFEDYWQMSDYIRKHGPMPTDKQVRVRSRVICLGGSRTFPAEREGHDSG
jgi:hypothetical protein